MKTVFLKNKYIITAIIFFVLDLSLTWYYINYTEDALEGNPLFDLDGGYLALLLNVIYLSLIYVLEKFALNRHRTINLEAVSSFDYFKKLMSSNKNNFIFISFIFSFVVATLSSRFIAIIDWIIYGIYKSNFYTTKYAILRSKMPLERFDPVVMVIVFAMSLIFWYKMEYKKQSTIIIETNKI